MKPCTCIDARLEDLKRQEREHAELCAHHNRERDALRRRIKRLRKRIAKSEVEGGVISYREVTASKAKHIKG